MRIKFVLEERSDTECDIQYSGKEPENQTGHADPEETEELGA